MHLKTSIILFTTLLFFGACKLADIRTPAIKALDENVAPIDPKAKAILDETMKAYGGLEKWKQVQTTTMTYTDAWPNFPYSFVNPWPEKEQKLEQVFHNRTFNSEMMLMNGKKIGKHFGISNDSTYHIIDGKRKYKKSGKLGFYLPTYQYFNEFPYWMNSIPILQYAGTDTLNGKSCVLLFGTWKSIKPNAKYDQYILWINKETHLIDCMQFTIRDQLRNAKGCNKMSDFRDVNGLKFAFSQVITPMPRKQKAVHIMKYEKITWK